MGLFENWETVFIVEGPAWLPSHKTDELQGFGFALALVVQHPERRNYFGLRQLCLLVYVAGLGYLHPLSLGHQAQGNGFGSFFWF